MFFYLRGKITHLEASVAVIDVNGVGYELRITVPTYTQLKDKPEVKLYTYFHVSENVQALYGFLTLEEKHLFMQTISVSGIGTATALTIFSSMSSEEFVEAILGEDTRAIESVKGIGPKTAKRVILELKDKVKKGAGSSDLTATVQTASLSKSLRSEALDALVALGIARQAAEKSIATVLKAQGQDITLEQLIKLSLKTR